VVEGAGFTFRRGDRDDLAVMLDLLIHNPALRRRAAMNERERIQSQYLWPEIAQSIERGVLPRSGWRDHAPQEQVVDSGERSSVSGSNSSRMSRV